MGGDRVLGTAVVGYLPIDHSDNNTDVSFFFHLDIHPVFRK